MLIRRTKGVYLVYENLYMTGLAQVVRKEEVEALSHVPCSLWACTLIREAIEKQHMALVAKIPVSLISR